MSENYKTIGEASREAFPNNTVTLARGNTFFSHLLQREGFVKGAEYVISLLEEEFISDRVPDNSSCCYQWEMKEFINKLKHNYYGDDYEKRGCRIIEDRK